MIRLFMPFFQWFAATDWFMRVGPRVMPKFDRVLRPLARGRLLSGGPLPTLVLTSTGAKTGLPRSTPLACRPEPGGALLVVGSNFGHDRHPAWSANLIRTPEARVGFGGREFAVTAVLLTGGERAAVWPGLIEQWPLYARYTDKSGRQLRVFRLIPMH
jgi:deazaflavin-dependent oxidoreductase (nitroreductase family)